MVAAPVTCPQNKKLKKTGDAGIIISMRSDHTLFSSTTPSGVSNSTTDLAEVITLSSR